MTGINLTQTVVSVQNGNEQAFRVLYNEYVKRTHFLALKLMKNSHDAEEITQDVFQTVYIKIGELKNPEAFESWLNRITTNKCTDALRKTNLLTVSSAEEEIDIEFIEETDHSLIPHKALDNAQTARLIIEIIDKLPLPQRVCVYYYYYENLSVKEISEQLAVNENTVKTRLALAREKIRKELEQLEEKSGIKLYMASPLILIPAFKLVANNTEPPTEMLSTITADLSFKAPATASAGFPIKAIAAITAGIVVTAGVTTGIIVSNLSGGTPESTSTPRTTSETYSFDTSKAVTFNGRSYMIFDGVAETWEEAKSFCEEEGGYLAIIRTPEENEFLYNYITSNNLTSAYFGLARTDDGDWVWINNQPLEYSNWAPGEPSGGNEKYGMFYRQFTDGQWNDGDFGSETLSGGVAFICEWDYLIK
ncbi:MAG: sigma-70 family RNA polymerase sigma factor [Oscillospiraceae bacterium]|nr:sigma-70 family RNA polymerase sigma factor [Oscillospiraceae bacterium]